ncbi:aminoglycoside 6'-N-acetyltransferase [Acetobacter persici]|uniref:aminoglycoside 6'-N-acetyltransferase n=1 Tax=Acetobacter persici TaxID=1076596 RepID=UPI0039EBB2DE
MITIIPATGETLESWARLRASLWPETSEATHKSELEDYFRNSSARSSAFLARTDTGLVVGFAEAGLRTDYVNGCTTSPVVFLEGIYVLEPYRRQDIARRLCEAVALWGKSLGCMEFASDAPLENNASRSFHAAMGFIETEQVVFFKRCL